jgi:hypothetical protein
MGAVIGNLAFQPDIRVFTLKLRPNRSNEIAYRPDAPLRRAKIEPKLVEGGHGLGVS